MLEGMASHHQLAYSTITEIRGKNRVTMRDDMRYFCSSNDICLRKLLLESMDSEQTVLVKPMHLCCNVCKEQCKCSQCYKQHQLSEVIGDIQA